MSHLKVTNIDHNNNKFNSDNNKITLPQIFKSQIYPDSIEIKIIRIWMNSWLESNKIESILSCSNSDYFFNILCENLNYPKKLFTLYEPFLGDKTLQFLTELWNTLISSQESPLKISNSIIIQENQRLENIILKDKKERDILKNFIAIHKLKTSDKFEKQKPKQDELKAETKHNKNDKYEKNESKRKKSSSSSSRSWYSHKFADPTKANKKYRSRSKSKSKQKREKRKDKYINRKDNFDKAFERKKSSSYTSASR